jgi:predicted MFS family arabinose efflux permease
MSSYHLRQLKSSPTMDQRVSIGRSLGDYAQPGLVHPAADFIRAAMGLRFLTRVRELRPPRLTILQGTFGRVWLAFLTFHLALHLSIPLYPIYWVNEIGQPDSALSLGNALFYSSVLVGSTQIARIIRRLGNHRVTIVGAAALVLYPGLTSMTHTVGMYLIVNIVSGLASSLINAAMPNHILDRIPEHDRPSYLAWINLAANAAILAGSVVGLLIAGHLGLSAAPALFAAARLVAAIAVWRWG